jgi:hypothetical protein
MSKSIPEFKANGYLEKSYLDKEGAKHATFEFSVKDALKIAQLELMGRDLANHSPVLLEVIVKQSLLRDYKNAPKNKSKIVR